MSDDIVDLIDRAMYDYSTSPDAMRWAPDQVADVDDETTSTPVTKDRWETTTW